MQGFNYNLTRGLVTKLSKLQGPKCKWPFHISKRRLRNGKGKNANGHFTSYSSVAISVDFMLYKCRGNHGCEIWYDFVICTFMDLYGSLRNGNWSRIFYIIDIDMLWYMMEVWGNREIEWKLEKLCVNLMCMWEKYDVG